MALHYAMQSDVLTGMARTHVKNQLNRPILPATHAHSHFAFTYPMQISPMHVCALRGMRWVLLLPRLVRGSSAATTALIGFHSAFTQATDL